MGGQTSSTSSKSNSQALSTQAIWGPQSEALQNMFSGATNLLNKQAGQIPGQAAAIGGQVNPAAMTGLRQMQQFANPNSALARQQLAGATADITQNFERSILPTLRTGAGVVGGMGGSREALARGVAAGDASRAISQAGTDIYSHQYDLAQNAAGMLPGMAQDVFNLGMAPSAAAWAPYASAASIYGSPTSLTTSKAQSKSGSKSSAYGFNLF